MADRRGPARPPLLALSVAAVATIALAVIPVGAATAQDGVTIDGEPCTDGVGVTVVVDFQELGDDTVVVRCATEAPADGFAALDAAGVPYRTTITFPGFLCRLFEEPADDPCATASPADAYWSYWLAPAGGEWCYSNKGAGSRTPPPGSVEGWSFSLDRTSEDVPPPRVAPPSPPEGTEAAPLADSDCGAGPVAGVGQTPAGIGAAAPEGTTAGEGPSADPESAVGRGGPIDLDATTDDGSPIGTLVGVAAVAALAAVAIAVAARRRSITAAAATAGPTPPPAPPDDVWRRPEMASPVSGVPGDDPAVGPGPGRDEPLPDVTRAARPDDDGGDAGPDR